MNDLGIYTSSSGINLLEFYKEGDLLAEGFNEDLLEF
jgi:hypothetical protein